MPAGCRKDEPGDHAWVMPPPVDAGPDVEDLPQLEKKWMDGRWKYSVPEAPARTPRTLASVPNAGPPLANVEPPKPPRTKRGALVVSEPSRHHTVSSPVITGTSVAWAVDRTLLVARASDLGEPRTFKGAEDVTGPVATEGDIAAILVDPRGADGRALAGPHKRRPRGSDVVGTLLRIDATDATRVRRVDLGSEANALAGGPLAAPSNPMAVAHDRAVATCGDVVCAFSATDGHSVFARRVVARTRFGASIVVAPAGFLVGDDAGVVLLDASDGAPLWSAALDGGCALAPFVAQRHVFVADAGALHAIDVTTGARVWKLDVTGRTFRAPFTRDLMWMDGAGEGALHVVATTSLGATALDVDTIEGKLLAERSPAFPLISSPVVAGPWGLVHTTFERAPAAAGEGLRDWILLLDPVTLEPRKRFDVENTARGSRAAIASGRLYVTTVEGALRVFAID